MRTDERGIFVDVEFLLNGPLSPGEKMDWLRFLSQHLKSRPRSGEVPGHRYGLPRKRVNTYLELGLMDEIGGVLHIREWDEWNGWKGYKRWLVRERVRRHRERKRDQM